MYRDSGRRFDDSFRGGCVIFLYDITMELRIIGIVIKAVSQTVRCSSLPAAGATSGNAQCGFTAIVAWDAVLYKLFPDQNLQRKTKKSNSGTLWDTSASACVERIKVLEAETQKTSDLQQGYAGG